MKEPEVYARQVKICYRCGSSNCRFQYLNNKKQGQPRYLCLDCKDRFTFGEHKRPYGKKYVKKKGEDPEELRGLHRQCPNCGVADRAPFKYYNNNSPVQPRFECSDCREQFQMRLVNKGTDTVHLLHSKTSTKRAKTSSKPANTRSKPAKPIQPRVQKRAPIVVNRKHPEMFENHGLAHTVVATNVGPVLDFDTIYRSFKADLITQPPPANSCQVPIHNTGPPLVHNADEQVGLVGLADLVGLDLPDLDSLVTNADGQMGLEDLRDFMTEEADEWGGHQGNLEEPSTASVFMHPAEPVLFGQNLEEPQQEALQEQAPSSFQDMIRNELRSVDSYYNTYVEPVTPVS